MDSTAPKKLVKSLGPFILSVLVFLAANIIAGRLMQRQQMENKASYFGEPTGPGPVPRQWDEG